MNKSKISAYDLTSAPLFSIFPFHTMRIGSKPRARDETQSLHLAVFSVEPNGRQT